MAERDQEKLDRLADAVADGAEVDWERESGESGDRVRRQIHNLRLVQQIERAHQSVPTAVDPQEETRELEAAPTSWGPLKVGVLLDRGGYGQVFRAHDPALQTDVALKLLHRAAADRDPHDEAFLSEARKLARVRHPNVLTVHGVAVHDDVVGLWTELLDGMTLERCMSVQGTFSAREAALVGIDLCRALSAVHGAGLVHRDVKTKNIMREKGGRIVLLDFSAGSERTSGSSSVAGTPLFMAPELFDGRDSGIAVDIYSLGVVLYRLVTGRFPVQADDVSELRGAHQRGAMTPLLDARANLPAGFVRAVERSLDADPRKRFASAGEMERELAAFVGAAPEPVDGSLDDGKTIRISKPVLAAAAIVLLALVAVAYWVVSSGPSPFDAEGEWVRVRDGRSETVGEGARLDSTDCLRLKLRGNVPMYVYVFNEDASGQTTVLFPNEGGDLDNPLTSAESHQLPGPVVGGEGCWEMSGGGGDNMLVIASRDPLPDLESEIASMPRVDGSSARTIPSGDWGRRLRGVNGLVVPEEQGATLSDLEQSLAAEAARRAGIWFWLTSFGGPASESEGEPVSRALPESEVERLERLLFDRPDDPDLLAKLAGKLLIGGVSPDELQHHVRALELATLAFEIDPEHLAACEARAVALERVFLTERAIEATKNCLKLGGDERFRERLFARSRRLAATRASNAASDANGESDPVALASFALHRAVRIAEDELLPTWAEQIVGNENREAEETLSTLESIAQTVNEQIGDRSLSDMTAALRDAYESSSPDRARALAGAHAAHAAGNEYRRAGDYGRARESFVTARAAFRAAGGSYELHARYSIAVCDYSDGRLDEAEREFSAMSDPADSAGYRSLLGQIHWMKGLTLARQSKMSQSLRHYGTAADIFATIRDENRTAAIQVQAAQVHDLLGSHDRGWRKRFGALSRIERIDDPRRRHQVLLTSALAAADQGYPRAAVELERTGLELARKRRDSVEFINGSSRLASFLQSLDRLEEAERVLTEARIWLATHPESGRPEQDAELAIAEGRLFLKSRPDQSVLALDRAIAYYEPDLQARLAELYPMRGRALSEAARFDAAEEDLLAGIEFYETARRDIVDQLDRITFSDTARRVYDEMIRFQIDVRRRPDLALEFAERGRARLLQKWVDLDRAPSRVSEWTGLMPPDMAWVYYLVLDDQLLIWVGRDGNVDYFSRPVDEQRLRTQVQVLGRIVEQNYDEHEIRPRLLELHDLLVASVGSSLRGIRTLVVLPDKSLHGVPFAALLDRSTGRHLIQDLDLATAPSLALLANAVHSIRKDRDASVPVSTKALVFGSPLLAGADFRSLEALAGAAEEASEIAQIYQTKHLYRGKEATRVRFLMEIEKHEIVHFAGHALSSGNDPLMSRLIMASAPGSDSSEDLYAHDLYGLDLRGVRLVVLAACETASGHVSSSEGSISLARPFLAGGVPAVVATLWRIDDALSRKVFVRFHQVYRETGNPIHALGEAQRAALEPTSEPPMSLGTWSAVQLVVGGAVEFEGGKIDG